MASSVLQHERGAAQRIAPRSHVDVVVDGHAFHVERQLLIECSPFFRKTLEKPENCHKNKLKLSGVSAATFAVLYSYMTTGKLDMSPEIVADVFNAAFRLHMSDVVKKCIQVETETTPMGQQILMYSAARRLNLTEEEHRAYNFLTAHFMSVVATKEFLEMDVDDIVLLMSADTIGCHCEAEVFEAGMRWLNYAPEQRLVNSEKVMSAVRFDQMNLSELNQCLDYPGLPEMVAVKKIVIEAITSWISNETGNKEAHLDKKMTRQYTPLEQKSNVSVAAEDDELCSVSTTGVPLSADPASAMYATSDRSLVDNPLFQTGATLVLKDQAKTTASADTLGASQGDERSANFFRANSATFFRPLPTTTAPLGRSSHNASSFISTPMTGDSSGSFVEEKIQEQKISQTRTEEIRTVHIIRRSRSSRHRALNERSPWSKADTRNTASSAIKSGGANVVPATGQKAEDQRFVVPQSSTKQQETTAQQQKTVGSRKSVEEHSTRETKSERALSTSYASSQYSFGEVASADQMRAVEGASPDSADVVSAPSPVSTRPSTVSVGEVGAFSDRAESVAESYQAKDISCTSSMYSLAAEEQDLTGQAPWRHSGADGGEAPLKNDNSGFGNTAIPSASEKSFPAFSWDSAEMSEYQTGSIAKSLSEEKSTKDKSQSLERDAPVTVPFMKEGSMPRSNSMEFEHAETMSDEEIKERSAPESTTVADDQPATGSALNLISGRVVESDIPHLTKEVDMFEQSKMGASSATQLAPDNALPGLSPGMTPSSTQSAAYTVRTVKLKSRDWEPSITFTPDNSLPEAQAYVDSPTNQSSADKVKQDVQEWDSSLVLTPEKQFPKMSPGMVTPSTQTGTDTKTLVLVEWFPLPIVATDGALTAFPPGSDSGARDTVPTSESIAKTAETPLSPTPCTTPQFGQLAEGAETVSGFFSISDSGTPSDALEVASPQSTDPVEEKVQVTEQHERDESPAEEPFLTSLSEDVVKKTAALGTRTKVDEKPYRAASEAKSGAEIISAPEEKTAVENEVSYSSVLLASSFDGSKELSDSGEPKGDRDSPLEDIVDTFGEASEMTAKAPARISAALLQELRQKKPDFDFAGIFGEAVGQVHQTPTPVETVQEVRSSKDETATTLNTEFLSDDPFVCYSRAETAPESAGKSETFSEFNNMPASKSVALFDTKRFFTESNERAASIDVSLAKPKKLQTSLETATAEPDVEVSNAEIELLRENLKGSPLEPGESLSEAILNFGERPEEKRQILSSETTETEAPKMTEESPDKPQEGELEEQSGSEKGSVENEKSTPGESSPIEAGAAEENVSKQFYEKVSPTDIKKRLIENTEVELNEDQELTKSVEPKTTNGKGYEEIEQESSDPKKAIVPKETDFIMPQTDPGWTTHQLAGGKSSSVFSSDAEAPSASSTIPTIGTNGLTPPAGDLRSVSGESMTTGYMPAVSEGVGSDCVTDWSQVPFTTTSALSATSSLQPATHEEHSAEFALSASSATDNVSGQISGLLDEKSDKCSERPLSTLLMEARSDGSVLKDTLEPTTSNEFQRPMSVNKIESEECPSAASETGKSKSTVPAGSLISDVDVLSFVTLGEKNKPLKSTSEKGLGERSQQYVLHKTRIFASTPTYSVELVDDNVAPFSIPSEVTEEGSAKPKPDGVRQETKKSVPSKKTPSQMGDEEEDESSMKESSGSDTPPVREHASKRKRTRSQRRAASKPPVLQRTRIYAEGVCHSVELISEKSVVKGLEGLTNTACFRASTKRSKSRSHAPSLVQKMADIKDVLDLSSVSEENENAINATPKAEATRKMENISKKLSELNFKRAILQNASQNEPNQKRAEQIMKRVLALNRAEVSLQRNLSTLAYTNSSVPTFGSKSEEIFSSTNRDNLHRESEHTLPHLSKEVFMAKVNPLPTTLNTPKPGITYEDNPKSSHDMIHTKTVVTVNGHMLPDTDATRTTVVITGPDKNRMKIHMARPPLSSEPSEVQTFGDEKCADSDDSFKTGKENSDRKTMSEPSLLSSKHLNTDIEIGSSSFPEHMYIAQQREVVSTTAVPLKDQSSVTDTEALRMVFLTAQSMGRSSTNNKIADTTPTSVITGDQGQHMETARTAPTGPSLASGPQNVPASPFQAPGSDKKLSSQLPIKTIRKTLVLETVTKTVIEKKESSKVVTDISTGLEHKDTILESTTKEEVQSKREEESIESYDSNISVLQRSAAFNAQDPTPETTAKSNESIPRSALVIKDSSTATSASISVASDKPKRTKQPVAIRVYDDTMIEEERESPSFSLDDQQGDEQRSMLKPLDDLNAMSSLAAEPDERRRIEFQDSDEVKILEVSPPQMPNTGVEEEEGEMSPLPFRFKLNRKDSIAVTKLRMLKGHEDLSDEEMEDEDEDKEQDSFLASNTAGDDKAGATHHLVFQAPTVIPIIPETSVATDGGDEEGLDLNVTQDMAQGVLPPSQTTETTQDGSGNATQDDGVTHNSVARVDGVVKSDQDQAGPSQPVTTSESTEFPIIHEVQNNSTVKEQNLVSESSVNRSVKEIKNIENSIVTSETEEVYYYPKEKVTKKHISETKVLTETRSYTEIVIEPNLSDSSFKMPAIPEENESLKAVQSPGALAQSFSDLSMYRMAKEQHKSVSKEASLSTEPKETEGFRGAPVIFRSQSENATKQTSVPTLFREQFGFAEKVEPVNQKSSVENSVDFVPSEPREPDKRAAKWSAKRGSTNAESDAFGEIIGSETASSDFETCKGPSDRPLSEVSPLRSVSVSGTKDDEFFPGTTDDVLVTLEQPPVSPLDKTREIDSSAEWPLVTVSAEVPSQERRKVSSEEAKMTALSLPDDGTLFRLDHLGPSQVATGALRADDECGSIGLAPRELESHPLEDAASERQLYRTNEQSTTGSHARIEWIERPEPGDVGRRRSFEMFIPEPQAPETHAPVTMTAVTLPTTKSSPASSGAAREKDARETFGETTVPRNVGELASVEVLYDSDTKATPFHDMSKVDAGPTTTELFEGEGATNVVQTKRGDSLSELPSLTWQPEAVITEQGAATYFLETIPEARSSETEFNGKKEFEISAIATGTLGQSEENERDMKMIEPVSSKLTPDRLIAEAPVMATATLGELPVPDIITGDSTSPDTSRTSREFLSIGGTPMTISATASLKAEFEPPPGGDTPKTKKEKNVRTESALQVSSERDVMLLAPEVNLITGSTTKGSAEAEQQEFAVGHVDTLGRILSGPCVTPPWLRRADVTESERPSLSTLNELEQATLSYDCTEGTYVSAERWKPNSVETRDTKELPTTTVGVASKFLELKDTTPVPYLGETLPGSIKELDSVALKLPEEHEVARSGLAPDMVRTSVEEGKVAPRLNTKLPERPVEPTLTTLGAPGKPIYVQKTKTFREQQIMTPTEDLSFNVLSYKSTDAEASFVDTYRAPGIPLSAEEPSLPANEIDESLRLANSTKEIASSASAAEPPVLIEACLKTHLPDVIVWPTSPASEEESVKGTAGETPSREKQFATLEETSDYLEHEEEVQSSTRSPKLAVIMSLKSDPTKQKSSIEKEMSILELEGESPGPLKLRLEAQLPDVVPSEEIYVTSTVPVNTHTMVSTGQPTDLSSTSAPPDVLPDLVWASELPSKYQNEPSVTVQRQIRPLESRSEGRKCGIVTDTNTDLATNEWQLVPRSENTQVVSSSEGEMTVVEASVKTTSGAASARADNELSSSGGPLIPLLVHAQERFTGTRVDIGITLSPVYCDDIGNMGMIPHVSIRQQGPVSVKPLRGDVRPNSLFPLLGASDKLEVNQHFDTTHELPDVTVPCNALPTDTQISITASREVPWSLPTNPERRTPLRIPDVEIVPISTASNIGQRQEKSGKELSRVGKVPPQTRGNQSFEGLKKFGYQVPSVVPGFVKESSQQPTMVQNMSTTMHKQLETIPPGTLEEEASVSRWKRLSEMSPPSSDQTGLPRKDGTPFGFPELKTVDPFAGEESEHVPDSTEVGIYIRQFGRPTIPSPELQAVLERNQGYVSRSFSSRTEQSLGASTKLLTQITNQTETPPEKTREHATLVSTLKAKTKQPPEGEKTFPAADALHVRPAAMQPEVCDVWSPANAGIDDLLKQIETQELPPQAQGSQMQSLKLKTMGILPETHLETPVTQGKEKQSGLFDRQTDGQLTTNEKTKPHDLSFITSEGSLVVLSDGKVFVKRPSVDERNLEDESSFSTNRPSRRSVSLEPCETVLDGTSIPCKVPPVVTDDAEPDDAKSRRDSSVSETPSNESLRGEKGQVIEDISGFVPLSSRRQTLESLYRSEQDANNEDINNLVGTVTKKLETLSSSPEHRQIDEARQPEKKSESVKNEKTQQSVVPVGAVNVRALIRQMNAQQQPPILSLPSKDFATEMVKKDLSPQQMEQEQGVQRPGKVAEFITTAPKPDTKALEMFLCKKKESEAAPDIQIQPALQTPPDAESALSSKRAPSFVSKQDFPGTFNTEFPPKDAVEDETACAAIPGPEITTTSNLGTSAIPIPPPEPTYESIPAFRFAPIPPTKTQLETDAIREFPDNKDLKEECKRNSSPPRTDEKWKLIGLLASEEAKKNQGARDSRRFSDSTRRSEHKPLVPLFGEQTSTKEPQEPQVTTGKDDSKPSPGFPRKRGSEDEYYGKLKTNKKEAIPWSTKPSENKARKKRDNGTEETKPFDEQANKAESLELETSKAPPPVPPPAPEKRLDTKSLPDTSLHKVLDEQPVLEEKSMTLPAKKGDTLQMRSFDYTETSAGGVTGSDEEENLGSSIRSIKTLLKAKDRQLRRSNGVSSGGEDSVIVHSAVGSVSSHPQPVQPHEKPSESPSLALQRQAIDFNTNLVSKSSLQYKLAPGPFGFIQIEEGLQSDVSPQTVNKLPPEPQRGSREFDAVNLESHPKNVSNSKSDTTMTRTPEAKKLAEQAENPALFTHISDSMKEVEPLRGTTLPSSKGQQPELPTEQSQVMVPKKEDSLSKFVKNQKDINQKTDTEPMQLKSAQTYRNIPDTKHTPKGLGSSLETSKSLPEFTQLQSKPEKSIPDHVDTHPIQQSQRVQTSLAMSTGQLNDDESQTYQGQPGGQDRSSSALPPNQEAEGSEKVTKEELERYIKLVKELQLRRGSAMPPSGTLQPVDSVVTARQKPSLVMETRIELFGKGRVTFSFDAVAEEGGGVCSDDSYTSLVRKGAPSTTHTPKRTSIDVRVPPPTPATSMDLLKRKSVDFGHWEDEDSMRYEPQEPPNAVSQAAKRRHSEHTKGQPGDDVNKRRHSEPGTLTSGSKEGIDGKGTPTSTLELQSERTIGGEEPPFPSTAGSCLPCDVLTRAELLAEAAILAASIEAQLRKASKVAEARDSRGPEGTLSTSLTHIEEPPKTLVTTETPANVSASENARTQFRGRTEFSSEKDAEQALGKPVEEVPRQELVERLGSALSDRSLSPGAATDEEGYATCESRMGAKSSEAQSSEELPVPRGVRGSASGTVKEPPSMGALGEEQELTQEHALKEETLPKPVSPVAKESKVNPEILSKAASKPKLLSAVEISEQKTFKPESTIEMAEIKAATDLKPAAPVEALAKEVSPPAVKPSQQIPAVVPEVVVVSPVRAVSTRDYETGTVRQPIRRDEAAAGGFMDFTKYPSATTYKKSTVPPTLGEKPAFTELEHQPSERREPESMTAVDTSLVPVQKAVKEPTSDKLVEQSGFEPSEQLVAEKVSEKGKPFEAAAPSATLEQPVPEITLELEGPLEEDRLAVADQRHSLEAILIAHKAEAEPAETTTEPQQQPELLEGKPEVANQRHSLEATLLEPVAGVEPAETTPTKLLQQPELLEGIPKSTMASTLTKALEVASSAEAPKTEAMPGYKALPHRDVLTEAREERMVQDEQPRDKVLVERGFEVPALTKAAHSLAEIKGFEVAKPEVEKSPVELEAEVAPKAAKGATSSEKAKASYAPGPMTFNVPALRPLAHPETDTKPEPEKAASAFEGEKAGMAEASMTSSNSKEIVEYNAGALEEPRSKNEMMLPEGGKPSLLAEVAEDVAARELGVVPSADKPASRKIEEKPTKAELVGGVDEMKKIWDQKPQVDKANKLIKEPATVVVTDQIVPEVGIKLCDRDTASPPSVKLEAPLSEQGAGVEELETVEVAGKQVELEATQKPTYLQTEEVSPEGEGKYLKEGAGVVKERPVVKELEALVYDAEITPHVETKTAGAIVRPTPSGGTKLAVEKPVFSKEFEPRAEYELIPEQDGRTATEPSATEVAAAPTSEEVGIAPKVADKTLMKDAAADPAQLNISVEISTSSQEASDIEREREPKVSSLKVPEVVLEEEKRVREILEYETSLSRTRGTGTVPRSEELLHVSSPLPDHAEAPELVPPGEKLSISEGASTPELAGFPLFAAKTPEGPSAASVKPDSEQGKPILDPAEFNKGPMSDWETELQELRESRLHETPYGSKEEPIGEAPGREVTSDGEGQKSEGARQFIITTWKEGDKEPPPPTEWPGGASAAPSTSYESAASQVDPLIIVYERDVLDLITPDYEIKIKNEREVKRRAPEQEETKESSAASPRTFIRSAESPEPCLEVAPELVFHHVSFPEAQGPEVSAVHIKQQESKPVMKNIFDEKQAELRAPVEPVSIEGTLETAQPEEPVKDIRAATAGEVASERPVKPETLDQKEQSPDFEKETEKSSRGGRSLGDDAGTSELPEGTLDTDIPEPSSSNVSSESKEGAPAKTDLEEKEKKKPSKESLLPAAKKEPIDKLDVEPRTIIPLFEVPPTDKVEAKPEENAKEVEPDNKPAEGQTVSLQEPPTGEKEGTIELEPGLAERDKKPEPSQPKSLEENEMPETKETPTAKEAEEEEVISKKTEPEVASEAPEKRQFLSDRLPEQQLKEVPEPSAEKEQQVEHEMGLEVYAPLGEEKAAKPLERSEEEEPKPGAQPETEGQCVPYIAPPTVEEADKDERVFGKAAESPSERTFLFTKPTHSEEMLKKAEATEILADKTPSKRTFLGAKPTPGEDVAVAQPEPLAEEPELPAENKVGKDEQPGPLVEKDTDLVERIADFLLEDMGKKSQELQKLGEGEVKKTTEPEVHALQEDEQRGLLEDKRGEAAPIVEGSISPELVEDSRSTSPKRLEDAERTPQKIEEKKSLPLSRDEAKGQEPMFDWDIGPSRESLPARPATRTADTQTEMSTDLFRAKDVREASTYAFLSEDAEEGRRAPDDYLPLYLHRVTLNDKPSIAEMIRKLTPCSEEWEEAVPMNWKINPAKHLEKWPSPCIQDAHTPTLLLLGGINLSALGEVLTGCLILRYNLEENEWRRCDMMPLPRYGHRSVYMNGDIFIIGGFDNRDATYGLRMSTSFCFRFSTQTGEWSVTSPMHHARGYHGVAVLNNNIYAVGGVDANDLLLSSVERYSQDEDRWVVLEKGLYCGRMGMGVTAFQNTLWVVGGIVQIAGLQTCSTAYVEIYNPATDQWTYAASYLPSPRTCVSLLNVDDKELYCFGGIFYNCVGPVRKLLTVDDILVYSEKTKAWKQVASLPAPRHNAHVVQYKNQAFIIGGQDAETPDTPVTSVIKTAVPVDKFDWLTLKDVPLPISAYVAVVVPPLEEGTDLRGKSDQH